jgi:hypothetical protein
MAERRPLGAGDGTPLLTAPANWNQIWPTRRRPSGAGSTAMKVILSRKGFDSSYGGGPSPILVDGRMVSLPIPDPEPAALPYAAIQFEAGVSYADLMERIGIRRVGYPKPKGSNREWAPVREARAHLDPDLIGASLPRPAGWRPLFGQADIAESHLRREGVREGDLFLFFGWFRTVAGGREAEDLHAIYGYLQIAEVLDLGSEVIPPPWSEAHPHVVLREVYREASKGRNSLYVAAERLSFRPELPGAGTMGLYRDALRLTKPGSRLRSTWRLPECFNPAVSRLTYNQAPWRWQLDGDGFQVRSAYRGQEFVIDASGGILRWLESLFAPLSGAARVAIAPSDA